MPVVIEPATATPSGEFMAAYPRAWGQHAVIDLHGCDPERLASPAAVRRFFTELVHATGMKAHGPLHIERFGAGELEGLSAVQLIETSSITFHADETGSRAFIDVFSCKLFSAEAAGAVALKYFGGTYVMTVAARGA
jgi:S-adenosylmethionine/arginine decarboxylase-like enzyme